MELDSVLVTGANRGIGLEFVRQLVKLPKPPKYVFATYRSVGTTQGLEEIKSSTKVCQVILVKLDVTIASDVEACRKLVEYTVGERGLTLLINNAGAMKQAPFPDVTEENLVFHFRTNTVAPVVILKELFPVLETASVHRGKGESKKFNRAGVLNISSMGGSNANSDKINSTFPGVLGYQVSKAALNMAMRAIAITMRDKNVLMVQMCPGWVKTDMGQHGQIDVSTSVSTIFHTLATLNEKHHGTFIDREGNPIPY